ncbi:NYN domain-containing protein [Ammonifex thiophilus]|uniref:NYN domain-containing protein n=1 Tax=Ammonifex thiophilus TaxID=444093 RepID=A0A3D8P255_9THEO|nr:NYN domain-containing protein [Ammonifex thiophilus]RDV82295.1 NYN domain-containing protein [Ammonifex thiophilus]
MQEITLIDGYNLIYALEMEKNKADLAHARDCLVELLEEYAALTGKELIVVFDAYRVKGGQGSCEARRGVRVIFTRERETADTVIERLVGELTGEFLVTVVTGDWMEQRLVLGAGALRVTPREFWKQLNQVFSSRVRAQSPSFGRLDDCLPESLRQRFSEWKFK